MENDTSEYTPADREWFAEIAGDILEAKVEIAELWRTAHYPALGQAEILSTLSVIRQFQADAKITDDQYITLSQEILKMATDFVK